MNSQTGNLIATAMIAFSTSLGVLIALISFINQIRKISFIETALYFEIYLSVHLLFLYVLKKYIK